MQNDSALVRKGKSSSEVLREWYGAWRRNAGMGPLTYIIRLLVLLAFAVYFGVPLLWLLTAVTKTNNQMNELSPLAIGSLNYVGTAWEHLMIFNNGQVIRWAYNSVYYVVAGLVLSLSITIPAGYALAIMRFTGRKALLWATLILMIMPSAALVLPLFLEMNLFGLVNTPWAVILPAAFFPFGVYLSFVYYKSSMPPDLLDAGRVDGCSELQLFWYVGLPLARTLLGLLAFINFRNIWNNYFQAFVMLNDDRFFNLPVGIQALIAGTGAVRPTPYSATLLPIKRAEAALLGVITVLPVALVFLLSQRFVVTGLYAGATKE